MKSPVGFPERSQYWKKLRSEAGALDSFFYCRGSVEADYRQDSEMSPWYKETQDSSKPVVTSFFLYKLCLPGPHLPLTSLNFCFMDHLRCLFVFNLASYLPDLLRLSRPLTHSRWPVFAAASAGTPPPAPQAIRVAPVFCEAQEREQEVSTDICLSVLRVRLRYDWFCPDFTELQTWWLRG